MLEVKDLGYRYEKAEHALYEHVNLQFEKGKMYSIIGASGSGKTTFLSLIAGLDKPTTGEILFDSEPLSKIGLTNYRNQKVSIVFQAYNLLPYMTVMQNIQTAMEITGSTVKDKKDYILKMLDKVGIAEELANKNIKLLSGGQQQRIAIVRSMCCDRDLIVADEPTGNLDEETTKEIISLFKDLAHNENKCVIIVTHEKELSDQCDISLELKNRAFHRIK
ncbi:abc transporter [Trichococcus palustris]|uniref:Abc transporter n=1 Tax=Trichococcus palustris TaxID=140314 RepID=A0A143YCJ5_9LACT|nr:ABC transporter ATP-binding protein [Trichococcus palustris]CZQ85507.1 abc transporter [Trichococcus palustris]SFK56107.1 putative ABC transport system ATP-binding protein [Trichococcus palustris]